MSLHSLQIFVSRLERKHIAIFFVILCQTFVAKANYVKSLYLVKTRLAVRVPAEIWRQTEIWTLLCFLSPPTQKLPIRSPFLFFAKKINHILLKIGKKSTKHVAGDFPDNLKWRACSRNCCLSFRHRRNPSYLNLCLPSESVNSKLRLIVKRACC